MASPPTLAYPEEFIVTIGDDTKRVPVTMETFVSQVDDYVAQNKCIYQLLAQKLYKQYMQTGSEGRNFFRVSATTNDTKTGGLYEYKNAGQFIEHIKLLESLRRETQQLLDLITTTQQSACILATSAVPLRQMADSMPEIPRHVRSTTTTTVLTAQDLERVKSKLSETDRTICQHWLDIAAPTPFVDLTAVQLSNTAAKLLVGRLIHALGDSCRKTKEEFRLNYLPFHELGSMIAEVPASRRTTKSRQTSTPTAMDTQS